MSRSDSDLRASLRTGADAERLDVDAVVAHPRAVRRSRWRIAAAITGAALAVLAVAGVVTAVQLNRHSGTPAGGPGSTAQAAPCPVSVPAVSLGKGSGALFPADVTSINVCVYTVDRLTASRVLTGTVARRYTQRFEAAPSRGLICPQYVTQTTVAMLPMTPEWAGARGHRPDQRLRNGL
ncbi:MAG TPA: hypothetical protein VGJ59_08240 [Jatrophihabitantaceae bacterium]|jgi:hypothetical protein